MHSICKNSPCISCHQWHHSISTGSNFVHPIGHPISQFVNCGFKVIWDSVPLIARGAWRPSRELVGTFAFALVSFQSLAVGVAQFCTSTSNLFLGLLFSISLRHDPFADELLTVGHILTVLANPSDPSLPFLLILRSLGTRQTRPRT